MSSLQSQYQQKLLRLSTNKTRKLREQQNFILEEKYLNFINALERFENFLDDILVFDSSPNFETYKSYIDDEVQKLNVLKAETMQHFEDSLERMSETDNKELLQISLGKIEK
jgi:hypothetical protein